ARGGAQQPRTGPLHGPLGRAAQPDLHAGDPRPDQSDVPAGTMPILKRILVTLVCAAALACQERSREVVRLTGGDPARGPELARRYGCYSCHTIPGVRGADALVGPSLERIASRVYLAGHLPNTPDNLMQWIRHPQQVSPDTAMPDTGVTEED